MADIQKCKDPADPNRCQAVISTRGQCDNLAAEGSKFCLAHGGNRAQNEAEKLKIRNYRKSKWLARIQEHADSSGIKSLREEIGILRVLMEERLERCNDEHDLIMESQHISDLVMKIEHVVSSCHKLEDKLKFVVDRAELLQFASEIINIIGEEVVDEETLTLISDKILAHIGKIGESNDL